MKNRLLYFFILVSLMFVSCQESNKSNTTKDVQFEDVVYHDLDFEVVCKLGENLSYLDEIIYNFRMVSDSLFLVVNGTKVFMYNTDGE